MRAATTLAVAVMVAITAACETGSGPSPPTIVIASDLPTSGEPAANTVPLIHAVQLAIAQHPNIGAFRLKYMPLDDALGAGASAMLGVQNVKQMIADPRVMGMIGPFNSYVIRDEIPRANPKDLVMLSPSSTSPCLTTPPYCTDRLTALHATRPTNFFRIAPPDYTQGTAMARLAANMGIKRVAVLNEWGDDGTTLLEHFTDEFAAGGGRVVWEQDLASDITNFTGFIGSAKAAGAQAIYAVGGPDVAFCQLGVQIGSNFAFLLATDGATNNGVNCLAGTTAAATAQTFGTYPDVDPRHSSDDRVKKVVEAYMRTYPNDKVLPEYTFAAYDCALILIDAITRVVEANGGGAPTRVQVLNAVAHGQFADGVTGTYAFDANGDATSPLMELWKVQDGRWIYVPQVDAGPKPT